MKLITIFNYPDEMKYNDLCWWWLDQAKKHACGLDIEVWYEHNVPAAMVPGVRREQKDRMPLEDLLPPQLIDEKAKHNVGFKLYNLCREDEPFIFVDADAIIFDDLSPLIDKSDDQPITMVNHQIIEGHTKHIPFKFLNSGVQICSDPDFLNFKKLMRSAREDGQYIVPGTDQAILYSYFKKRKYNYTHKDIGYGWNSCAGFTQEVDGKPVCKGLGKEYPVHINHYWYNYKPWQIDCPFYNQRVGV